MNLAMGMLLARLLAPPPVVTRTAILDSKPLHTESVVGDWRGNGSYSDELAEAEVVAPPSAEKVTALPNAESQITIPAEPWFEIATQLAELSNEIQLCLTSSNLQIARVTADKLRTQSTVWQQHCENALQHEQPTRRSDDAATTKSAEAIEALASQIRSTLSRIDTLDYEGPLEAVITSLQSEIESLDTLQKSVAESLSQTMLVST